MLRHKIRFAVISTTGEFLLLFTSSCILHNLGSIIKHKEYLQEIIWLSVYFNFDYIHNRKEIVPLYWNGPGWEKNRVGNYQI